MSTPVSCEATTTMYPVHACNFKELDKLIVDHPTCVTFSIEISKDCKKRYEIWDLNQFLLYYENNPSKRHYNEIIHSNRPCRLFFDAEEEGGDGITLDDWNIKMKEIDLVAKAYIKEQYDISIKQNGWWNSHRDGRMSSHLIYDCWFRSGPELSNVVEQMKSRLTPTTSRVIDMKPYATDGRKSLRMPWSYKFRLLYPLIPNGNGDEFDIKHFLSSLITVYQGETEPLTVDGIDVPLPPRPRRERTGLVTDEQVDRVHRWLREEKEVKDIYERGDNEWSLKPGIYCPIKGDRHVSQCTFFKIINESTGEYYCPDCKWTWATPENLKYVARQPTGMDVWVKAQTRYQTYLAHVQQVQQVQQQTTKSG